jgi:predicted phage-related endonuclease
LEELARPLAEEFIGSELFPVVCVREINGLKLLASMDGLTMEEREALEHKALNAGLKAAFVASGDSMDGSLLPLMYRVQMQQQLQKQKHKHAENVGKLNVLILKQQQKIPKLKKTKRKQQTL